MPMNMHEKKVVYESFEGLKEIYASSVVWEDNHVVVRYYKGKENKEFLHEDEVAGEYPNEKEIPLDRIYEVVKI